MWDELTPDAQAARTRQQLLQPVVPTNAEAGVFSNFLPGAGNYFMRSMAEAGRGLSMSAAAVPVALQAGIDAIDPKGRINDKRLDDSYFKWHDEVFGAAVDYWTPKAGEVGTAGQVLGSVAGGLTQFLASPALAVTTAQMSTGEDLVRAGVDPGAALVAGDIAALGTLVGIKLPVLGSTLAQRVATGVAGNVGQGAATAAATAAVLASPKANASPEVRAQFDPFDAKNRTIDALLGAAFGVAAHVGAPKFTPSERDALLVLNQARHLEDASLPGRPATEADLTRSVAAVRQAIDQMLKGEPVSVDSARVEMAADPAREAQARAAARVIAEVVPEFQQPIKAPDMLPGEKPMGADGLTPDAAAPSRPVFDESVRIPTGEFDPKTGDPTTISANDFIARADAELTRAKTNGADFLRAAAGCLLGSI